MSKTEADFEEKIDSLCNKLESIKSKNTHLCDKAIIAGFIAKELSELSEETLSVWYFQQSKKL